VLIVTRLEFKDLSSSIRIEHLLEDKSFERVEHFGLRARIFGHITQQNRLTRSVVRSSASGNTGPPELGESIGRFGIVTQIIGGIAHDLAPTAFTGRLCFCRGEGVNKERLYSNEKRGLRAKRMEWSAPAWPTS
jgi:hypothetical protein